MSNTMNESLVRLSSLPGLIIFNFNEYEDEYNSDDEDKAYSRKITSISRITLSKTLPSWAAMIDCILKLNCGEKITVEKLTVCNASKSPGLTEFWINTQILRVKTDVKTYVIIHGSLIIQCDVLSASSVILILKIVCKIVSKDKIYVRTSGGIVGDLLIVTD